MAEMYSNPAAYEAMMGRWSMRLAPLFVEFARVRDGDNVLDVGCGTGSLVQAVADKTRRSRVVGIDPVEPFIEYARSRFADPRISFERGSAFELPYEDASFDASLSALVLMLIPTPEKAAREMSRVTRPGGTVAACTWEAGGSISGALWEEAVKLDPAAPVERPRQCNRKGQLAELWQATGLKDVEETALEIQTNFSSFDDYWLPFLAGVGPPGVYVARLPADRRNALREALRKRHLGGRSDGAFSISVRAWAVRGTVPNY